ncbi:hypothetical protein [Paractinoplanes hotanensis]|uniref:Uncharacterized protein n=1 Tax=Paractinoplanes hotanensis TaxID=2906497 RepID=A0ABT0Y8F5_9ACTN|nr:hypothetical protein [Actinoplanes hotanensis]MCM4082319.1 hypothetical protein [Actinoplanes hotanensis]
MLDEQVDGAQLAHVQEERIRHAASPDPESVHAVDGFGGSPLRDLHPGCGVVRGLGALEPERPILLRTADLGVEDQSEAQILRLGVVKVHLELVAALVVQAQRLFGAGERGTHVHDEHRGVPVVEDVLVGDVEARVLPG